MPINELINRAVNNRKSLNDIYEKRKSTISEWNNQVKAIKEIFIIKDSNRWEKMLQSSLQLDKWEKIRKLIDGSENAKGILEKLKLLGDGVESGAFTTAYNRVTRKHINIGVVGAYRQGKSTLLKQLIHPTAQNLTANYLFPTNQGGIPCTGAPINYINNENEAEEGSQSIAIVRYHSVKSFCESINRYIDECHLESQGWTKFDMKKASISIIELSNYCAENRIKAMHIEDAQENTLQATFKKTIIYFDDYKDYLDRDEETIDISTAAGIQTFHRRSTFNFANITDNYSVYAVKEIDVKVGFQVAGEEVGSIQFLDTPGIGENRVGVDETLKRKLQNEIDTVIAIEKAHNQAPNTHALNTFHSSLTANYGDRQSSFIYYIINDSTSGDVMLINQAYKRAFKEGIEATTHPITLPKEKKLIIDCERNIVYDYALNLKGEITELQRIENYGCQQILHSIVTNLANNIDNIDRAFIEEAEQLYHDVEQQMTELQKLSKNIKINIGNNSGAVTRTLMELNKELTHITQNTIVKDVESKIEDYAKEDEIGIETLNALKKLHKVYENALNNEVIQNIISEVKQCQEEKKSEKFAELTLDAFDAINHQSGPCTDVDFNQWQEFKAYSDTKSILYKLVTSKIQELITPDPMRKSLEDSQNEIYDILRDKRFLGFLYDGSDNNEWYNRLIESINDSEWHERFDAFFKYDIDKVVYDFIEQEIIQKTIKSFMHRDDFNGCNFKTLKMANTSFLKSLWIIENRLKESLRNSNISIKKELEEKIDNDYKDKRTNAINFSYGVQDSMYPKIEQFISIHFDEILVCKGEGDEHQIQAALYNKWQDIFK